MLSGSRDSSVPCKQYLLQVPSLHYLHGCFFHTGAVIELLFDEEIGRQGVQAIDDKSIHSSLYPHQSVLLLDYCSQPWYC